jgi:hypothetical protein
MSKTNLITKRSEQLLSLIRQPPSKMKICFVFIFIFLFARCLYLYILIKSHTLLFTQFIYICIYRRISILRFSHLTWRLSYKRQQLLTPFCDEVRFTHLFSFCVVNTICVGHHYTQATTNNVNKTWTSTNIYPS